MVFLIALLEFLRRWRHTATYVRANYGINFGFDMQLDYTKN